MQGLLILSVYYVLNPLRAIEKDNSKSGFFNQIFTQQPMEDLQEP